MIFKIDVFQIKYFIGVDGVLPGLAGITHPSDVLDMPVDPNEPTYCLCHQVSYGEMIGCDNPDVRCLFCYILNLLSNLYFDSVQSNGFILHVSVLQLNLKGNGIVLNVHKIGKRSKILLFILNYVEGRWVSVFKFC